MKMFEHPKREFFTSKARLNFEVYGQNDKITPEAAEKNITFPEAADRCKRNR